MDASQLVALGVFASYFLLILGLLGVIVSSWRNDKSGADGGRVFLLLAFLSFAYTWYYMFSFMNWSFRTFESSPVGMDLEDDRPLYRVANWLVHTALFEQAWYAVCFGPSAWSWWWSQQLCLFTAGAWTIFLVLEGRRYGIKHIWAYMLFGQVVAISVAANLFYYAVARSRSNSRAHSASHVSPMIWVPVLLSLGTVFYSPYTSQSTFLPNLLTMHALLVVPLIGQASFLGTWASMETKTLYSTTAIIAFILHLRTSLSAIRHLPTEHRTLASVSQGIVGTLYYHPAQSSIGWDVVWTTLSFVAWVRYSRANSAQDLSTEGEKPSGADKPETSAGAAGAFVASFVGSVGFSAPLFLGRDL